MANNDGARQQIDLDFLDDGANYMADIYTDSTRDTGTATRVAVRAPQGTQGTAARL